MHPRSYAAFLLRADIFHACGDERAAQASLARATEIVAGDEDALLVLFSA
jgi:hypothetical protein